MVKDKGELRAPPPLVREQLCTHTAPHVRIALPLQPVREATVMTTSPSILLQTGPCKPSSGPRTEGLLFEWLVTRAVISSGKLWCTHTHPPTLANQPVVKAGCGSGAAPCSGAAAPGTPRESTQIHPEDLCGGKKGSDPLPVGAAGCRNCPHHQAVCTLSSRCAGREGRQSCPLSSGWGQPLWSLQNLFPGT